MLSIAAPCTDACASLLGGVVQKPTHLLGTETGCATGRCRCAHGPDQIVGFFHSGTEGFHAPHADVISQGHGSHEMRPTDAELLAHGERSWNDGTAGMGSTRGVIVVALVGMGQLAIRQCRLNGSTENLGGDDRRNLVAPVVPSELHCLYSGGKL